MAAILSRAFSCRLPWPIRCAAVMRKSREGFASGSMSKTLPAGASRPSPVSDGGDGSSCASVSGCAEELLRCSAVSASACGSRFCCWTFCAASSGGSGSHSRKRICSGARRVSLGHRKRGRRIRNRRGRIRSRFREKIKLIGVVRDDPLCHPPLRSPELKGHEMSPALVARDGLT